ATGTSLSLANGLEIQSGATVRLGEQGGVVYRSGNYNLSAGSLSTGNMTIGAAGGVVKFFQTGGEVTVNSSFMGGMFIGSSDNSTGAYEQSGGTLQVGELNVGSNFYYNSYGLSGVSADGNYTLSGDATLYAGRVNIGGTDAWNGSGTMNIDGGTAWVSRVTAGKNGLLHMSNGTVYYDTWVTPQQGGKILLSGGSLISPNGYGWNEIYGEFKQTGGEHRSGQMNIFGSYILDGGTLVVDDWHKQGMVLNGLMTIGTNASFSAIKFTQNGGTMHQQGSTAGIGALAINSGTYQMSGGSLSINSSWTMGEGGVFDFDNGNASVTVAAGASVLLSLEPINKFTPLQPPFAARISPPVWTIVPVEPSPPAMKMPLP
ncbi:MAG: hypothetical protein ACKOEM_17185, partial [Planctomycetia bacterium]